jgi:hypothetical protein
MDTLLAVGLIGTFMAAVTAMHLHLTARPSEAVQVHPLDDIDAELFRIIDREQLRSPR